MSNDRERLITAAKVKLGQGGYPARGAGQGGRRLPYVDFEDHTKVRSTPHCAVLLLLPLLRYFYMLHRHMMHSNSVSNTKLRPFSNPAQATKQCSRDTNGQQAGWTLCSILRLGRRPHLILKDLSGHRPMKRPNQWLAKEAFVEQTIMSGF